MSNIQICSEDKKKKRHRMKTNTSRVLHIHKIHRLCNLWTLLDSKTEPSSRIFTLLLSLHTKLLNALYHTPLFSSLPYCIFIPRSGQISSSYHLVRQVAHYVGQQSQLLCKNTNNFSMVIGDSYLIYVVYHYIK